MVIKSGFLPLRLKDTPVWTGDSLFPSACTAASTPTLRSDAAVNTTVQISSMDFASNSLVDMNRIGISGPYSSGLNILLLFKDEVSLCSLGWSGSLYFTLAYPVLGLQVCSSTPAAFQYFIPARVFGQPAPLVSGNCEC